VVTGSAGELQAEAAPFARRCSGVASVMPRMSRFRAGTVRLGRDILEADSRLFADDAAFDGLVVTDAFIMAGAPRQHRRVSRRCRR